MEKTTQDIIKEKVEEISDKHAWSSGEKKTMTYAVREAISFGMELEQKEREEELYSNQPATDRAGNPITYQE
jgi:hypothetical protein